MNDALGLKRTRCLWNLTGLHQDRALLPLVVGGWATENLGPEAKGALRQRYLGQVMAYSSSTVTLRVRNGESVIAGGHLRMLLGGSGTGFGCIAPDPRTWKYSIADHRSSHRASPPPPLLEPCYRHRHKQSHFIVGRPWRARPTTLPLSPQS